MKTALKYIIFFTLFISTQLYAQQVVVYRPGLNYSPNPEKYIGVNGSPYLFNEWAIGSAKTNDAAERKQIELRYDEIEDLLIMKGDGGLLYTFPLPVLEFTITDPKNNSVRKFRSGFAPAKLTTEKSFFEVLQDGKVALLRKNHKKLSTSKTLTGAVDKSIVEDVKYYLVISDNTPVAVRLDQKSINELLKDKQTELTDYTKTNKLNLKNPIDAAKLIGYYNSL